MKKGDILEGIIERVDFPNKGRVYTEDGMVTVKNGIPGQKIRFVVHKKRKNQAEGRLLEVLEKSSNRKTGSGVQQFSGLRRVYVPDDAL